jgi:hypothetical protein
MLNVAFIIGGSVAIAIAIWGKRFYEADVEGMPYRKEKEVSPIWGKASSELPVSCCSPSEF